MGGAIDRPATFEGTEKERLKMVSFNYFTILDPTLAQDLVKYGIKLFGAGLVVGSVAAWWFADRFTVEINRRIKGEEEGGQ